jgi:hypothetical protein
MLYPTPLSSWTRRATRFYANQAMLDYTGLTMQNPRTFAPERSIRKISIGCSKSAKEAWLATCHLKSSNDLPTKESMHMKMGPRTIYEKFSLQEFVTIQNYVRRMLMAGNPTLSKPWHEPWHDSLVRRKLTGGPDVYTIFFNRERSGSHAVVEVSGILPSILATVQFKLLQGAIFRTCARKDCRLPFEVTSRHARRFCTQYCAHITSLRQRRKLERQKR